MERFLSNILCPAFFIAASIICPVSGTAQSPGGAPNFPSIRSGEVARHVPNVARQDIGKRAEGEPVEISVILRFNHEDELGGLIAEQSNPASPRFRHFLSSQEFANRFSPTADQVATVVASLQAAGFQIGTIAPNKVLIRATAASGVVERFFQTELHTVIQEGYGVRYANVRPGVLPDELVSIVKNAKLDNLFLAYRPKLHRAPMSGDVVDLAKQLPEGVKSVQRPASVPLSARVPSALNGPLYDSGGALGPVAVAKALDFPVQHGFNGRHVNVGILMGGDVTDADLLSFFAAFQIPHQGMVYRAQVNGGGGVDPTVGLETALDVETVGSLAPGANTTIYMLPVYYDSQGNASMSSYDIDTAMQDIAFYNNQDVVSMSLGGPEAWDDAFQQAALQGVSEGITFCASAGDAGDVETPASVPFVVAVGGTDLTVTNTGSMQGNIVWNNPGFGSTGGGVSSLFSIASYQVGVSGLASRRMRNVPDVALPAQNVSVFFQGQFQSNLGFEVDGTSWSCPIFAALMASAVQYHGRLGMVQNLLYRDYRLKGERDFIDIAWGWNGTYVSHYGYDNCSGIGCPVGWELVVRGL